MKIELKKKLETIKPVSGAVKDYKSDPGDFTAAAYAALYYARKNKEDMILIPGGSYGRAVFHIARKSDDLRKYTVIADKAFVGVVLQSGDVYEAIATR